MPLPKSMNPLQHQGIRLHQPPRPQLVADEIIARQCTPKLSGASQLACNIVLAILACDGMKRIKSRAAANDGHFAHLCRLADMEINAS